MLIYETLRIDHLKIRFLLTELVKAGEVGERRRALLLLEEINDELVPHSRAEEAVFYKALSTTEEAQPLAVYHGVQEHADAESIVALLQSKRTLDPEWKRLAKKLQTTVESHIEDEENTVFAMARKILTEEQATEMAASFETLKPEAHKKTWIMRTVDKMIHLVPPKYGASLRTGVLKPKELFRNSLGSGR